MNEILLKRRLIAFLIFVIMANACSNYTSKNDYSVLALSDSLFVLNKEDNFVPSNYISNYKYVMFHCFNGNCSSCIIHLKTRASYIDSLFPKLGLIFVAQTEDTVMLNYYILDRLKFKPPVLWDKDSLFFYKMKGVINDAQTFCVNKKGEIILSGDPLSDKRIEKKMMRIVR